MRPITTLTMCAALAVAAAAAGAATQPEQRTYTGGRFYMEIGGKDDGYLGRVDSGGTATLDDRHKPVPSAVEGNQIEIISWSWGEASAPAAKFGAIGGIHRDAGVAGADSPTADDDAAKGKAAGTRPPRSTGWYRQAPVAGALKTVDESAAPTEKRQHGWITVSKPLERGAVRIKVKFPWVGCTVGTRYPALALGRDKERYELTDAVISECASDSVVLRYAKVKVRGWNPETKEL